MVKRVVYSALGLALMGITLFALTRPVSKLEGEMNTLTLEAGNGGTVETLQLDSYEPNTQISISAMENAGYLFDRWTTSDGGFFEDAFSMTTTFSMPVHSTTVTANFKPAAGASPLFVLTVTAGEGGDIPAGLEQVISGSYEQGAQITVPLRSVEGYIFDRWLTSDGGYFEDEYNPKSAFTMPGNSTTITATFKHNPPFSKPD